MVDGKNTEYQQLGIAPIALSDDVNLYIFQNDAYVWLSYDYPEGSYGTINMTVKTEKVVEALNLHVSAQLGEWKVGDETNIPKTPDSDLWWEIEGWTANPLWVNGIDTTTYDTTEFNFKNAEIRELQLSKERFGRGKWEINMKINAIKGKDGKFYAIDFPKEEEYYVLDVK